MADVVHSYSGDGLIIRRNNVPGTNRIHPFHASAVVAADLDGDGRDEIIANFPGYGIYAYRNDTSWAVVLASNAGRLAAGDLGGNGKTT